MDDCIPGPNLRRLLLGLHVERELVRLAASGIIWFTLAIVGSCAVIGLPGYVQKARSLAKVSHRAEAVTFGLE